MQLIYDLSLEMLEAWMSEHQQPKFRASQVFDWLYQKKVKSFSVMTNISIELQNLLDGNFYVVDLELVKRQISADKSEKYLFRLQDNYLIETVLMKQKYGNSLCVSSEVGCNMGCVFCASGLFKTKRGLTAGEMISQILTVSKIINEEIDSVVVMGTGEPFNNFSNLVTFLNILNHHKGLCMGARKVTVSTSGIVPKIIEFAKLPYQFNLAISLHAPNNKLRNELMPINKIYPIQKLFDAIREYLLIAKRRVSIEYILISNINDTPECARELAGLLTNLNVYVNLIPYNKITGKPFAKPSFKRQKEFLDILKKHKIDVTLRKEFATDITGACGMLRAMEGTKNA